MLRLSPCEESDVKFLSRGLADKPALLVSGESLCSLIQSSI